MSTGAVVPFPAGNDGDGTAAGVCPVCGRAQEGRHPVPPQVHIDRVPAQRLPDGLASVLTRTGEVSRRAREERAAERERIAALVTHLSDQIGLFVAAAERAGVAPPVTVHVTSGRPKVGRGGSRRCWAIRHWRLHGRTVGSIPRTRHLYVGADGALFESDDDPGLAAAHGSTPVVEMIDLTELLVRLGELDALRSSEYVIAGLADLMKDAGLSLQPANAASPPG